MIFDEKTPYYIKRYTVQKTAVCTQIYSIFSIHHGKGRIVMSFSKELLCNPDIILGDLKKTKAYRTLKRIRKEIKEEVQVARDRDPAATSNLEVLLLYSGVHAILAHKISHKLYQKHHYFTARLISQAARQLTGIEIHPGAKIGKGLFIDHGCGVVIGETTEIGENCTIYQGVTLGGTGKDIGKRHPTIGSGVMIGSGAKVLGPFTVGDNAKIAAGAVVLNAVPEGATAVGVPAKIIYPGRGKDKCKSDLDQIHIPDPVSTELCRLRCQIEQMESQIKRLEKESAGTRVSIDNNTENDD